MAAPSAKPGPRVESAAAAASTPVSPRRAGDGLPSPKVARQPGFLERLWQSPRKREKLLAKVRDGGAAMVIGSIGILIGAVFVKAVSLPLLIACVTGVPLGLAAILWSIATGEE